MSLPPPDAAIPDRSIDSVDALVSKYENHKNLRSSDIRADPILSALAAQQAVVLSPPRLVPQLKGPPAPVVQSAPPAFKARPAPSATRQEGLGPRMTKAAALRQGLEWEELRQEEGGRRQVDYANVPGHKRANLGINVKSLAAPSMAPKPTKASQLRAGETTTAATQTKRDREAMAAANKARGKEERARRRASVAPVASLGAPQIAPRGNRSSELRLGAPEPAPRLPTRSQSVLAKSSAPKAMPAESKARPASAVGQVKSLGAPAIAPRMNKSALLRAPASASATTSAITRRQQTAASAPTTMAPTQSAPSSAPSRPSRSASSTALAPKPTRASILRANLGAQVLSNRS